MPPEHRLQHRPRRWRCGQRQRRRSVHFGGRPSTTGGAPPIAGSPGSGGAVAHGGSTGGAGAPTITAGTGGGTTSGSGLGKGQYQGSGSTTDRNAQFDVYRNNLGYKFIANGWGTGWKSHEISWNGTSFTVKSLNGTQGSDYSPAGYPTMFCGLYSTPTGIQSDLTSPCGLPAAISSLKSVKTGWRWKSNGQGGEYNAAWDIWLGDSSNKLTSYVMVWLRDPPGQQPAGSPGLSGVTVTGLPGTWNIWQGSVNSHPIINYVQPEGHDLSELEFDVMDVYKDAVQALHEFDGNAALGGRDRLRGVERPRREHRDRRLLRPSRQVKIHRGFTSDEPDEFGRPVEKTNRIANHRCERSRQHRRGRERGDLTMRNRSQVQS